MSTTPERREGPSEDEIWEDLVSRLKENSDETLLAPDQLTPEQTTQAPDASGFSRFDPLNVSRAHAEAATPPTPPGRGRGPRDYSPSEEDEEEFVPSEPASLSTVEPAIALGWVGAAGAPIALLLSAMFWRSLPSAVVIGLVLVFLVASGYLVYRLPGHRDHGDDGAQL